MSTVIHRPPPTRRTITTLSRARPVEGVRWARRANCYRRRRAAVGVLFAVVAGGGVLLVDGVLSGPGGVPASAAGAATAVVEPAVVRAAEGDTLWSIAEEHHGPISLTRYVDALVALNGASTVVVAGQLVRLP